MYKQLLTESLNIHWIPPLVPFPAGLHCERTFPERNIVHKVINMESKLFFFMVIDFLNCESIITTTIVKQVQQIIVFQTIIMKC